MHLKRTQTLNNTTYIILLYLKYISQVSHIVAVRSFFRIRKIISLLYLQ